MFGLAKGAIFGASAAAGDADTGVSITVNGDAQVDTSRAKFGTGSLILDGNGDSLNAALDTSVIGQGAFTWECFFNVDTDPGDGTVAVLSNRTGSPDAGDIQMLYRNFDRKVQVNMYNSGSASYSANGVGSALALDTWHHFAFVRNSSNQVAVFVNGSRVASGTPTATTIDDNGAGLGIGAHADGTLEMNDGGSAGTDIGWIDEIRISDTDRYDPTSTSYTVPTSEFSTDANTLLLIHCNGADGSTTFTDES